MVLKTKRPSRKNSNASGTTSGLPNFVRLVEQYKRAVVGIEVTQDGATQRGFPFGVPWDRMGAPNTRSVNIGTGFMFDRRGYILTNEHVINGASRITLRLYGKKEPVPAQVVGSDPRYDIAILKANISTPETILKLGRSKDIKVGEWVVAIGSPLGLDHSVTVGIVSAKERPLQIGEREYPNLLQTDAAINRGNSGGPLINVKGDVIGMNTAVSQSSQGIGFAISADVLKETVKKILNRPSV